MSSSGDPTQRDSQALLEERNASAAKIQKYWKGVRLRRLEVREKFSHTLSTLVQNVDWKCFGLNSDFIWQLLFFFNAKRGEDVDMLCQLCEIILQYVKCAGDLVSVFAGVDSSEVKPVVIYRVRKLALICLRALHEKRFDWISRPKETADHLLYPNPESKAHEDHLQYFHFLGVLLGKAIYEGIPVGLVFAIFFLRKLKQKATFFNDLFSLDPEMYHGLLNLKNSDDLSHLYFTTVDGKELFPGGRKMHVTTHNVIMYLHLVANYQLNCQNREQTVQFLRGFQQLIPTEWTNMFNEHEFQLFISGPLSLNVEDLRLNTNYGGEYDMDHEVIIIFWKVLMSFSQNDQEQFLMYVTGCTRGPIRGFRTLDPKFGIISCGDDPNRLPLSSTCANQLHLPPYKTEEQMRGKLIQAMSSKSGFDLI